ncbi:MAG: glycosyltransferase family 2 protein [Verrucomicrobiota bacterium]
MNLEILAIVALVLAALPAGLFLANLGVYRRIGRGASSAKPEGLSVLIPARNEEHNLPATLASVLSNRDCDFEVIVLDDHSTDRTAAIVRDFARRDSRVRLESAPPLPPGWCGKPHACQALAGLARHSLLVFLDADVRLAPDALVRLALFMAKDSATATDPIALASGVPRQDLGTFSEKLLLPLIHFILMGFLPMHLMRRNRRPALSAGCGQLVVVRKDAYEHAGGHAKIRLTLHDGLKLTRLFRQAGLRTELFDPTDFATCRMYFTHRETWSGLAKNATEGLAAPGTIVPMTLLLLGGQVLPFVLLGGSGKLSPLALGLDLVAMALAYLPRFIAMRRFHQPFASALLHPVGVIAVLAIQWYALLRQVCGKPAIWKGRSYGAAASANPA